MPKDCHDTAVSYLEHRERSAHEVKSHLISKGFHEAEIEKELQYLQVLHYVDDARYCRSYISYGTGKGRGPVRLQFELAEKGIDPATIQEALEACFDRSTEKAAALKEAKKLLNRNRDAGFGLDSGEDEDDTDEPSAPDEKTVAKIGRKLASLGYHTDVIYDIIRQLRKV